MALVFLIGALVCLALGLLFASALWLALSLAASLVAAAVLLWSRALQWRMARGSEGSRPGTGPGTARPQLAQEAATPREAGATDTEVWVVDGRPRYHRRSCDLLAGQDPEPIPRTQADEDGFIACSLCEPDVDRSSRAS